MQAAPVNNAASEIFATESQKPGQDFHVHAAYDGVEYDSTKSEEPSQSAKLDSQEETEYPEKRRPQELQPEITDTDMVMAGLQAVQLTPDAPAVFSEAPEITDSPKNVRAQHNPPRRYQTLPREFQERTAVTDSAYRAGDSQDVMPDLSHEAPNQNGHEEITEPEMSQPSPSSARASAKDTDASDSDGKIQARATGTSRTAQRADFRTDSRRTDALNDFQTFFDSVNRNRRSPARASSQPLSLRTGTYEASGAQSQGRTLRNGIVNTVRFIRADGVRKANIIVDPPALGRISVELTSSTSGVEASVKVANEQIRQIVQDQFTQLRDNLLQQGVQVSEFTVDVQQDNSRQGQNSDSQNQRDYYSYEPSEDDDDTEIFRADLEEGLLYWVA